MTNLRSPRAAGDAGIHGYLRCLATAPDAAEPALLSSAQPHPAATQASSPDTEKLLCSQG